MTSRAAPARRSLFVRLLCGFGLVMFAVWIAVLALNIYEVKQVERRINAALLKSVALQILAGIVPLAERPQQVGAVVAKIERLQNAFFEEIGPHAAPFQVQVWQDGVLLHGSRNLPLAEPAPAERARALPLGADSERGAWLSWSESASGISVRVAQRHFYGIGMSQANLGYYTLPLLVSFPFLLLPAWFAIRSGLRPLTAIVDTIETRSAAELAPLAPSPYKELAPLVVSVNSLMARLDARLQREQEFLLDAAHELKTPLAVIQLNAEALASAAAPQRRREAELGLAQGVARATHTVHQLLSLARSGAEDASTAAATLDLAELVRERMALAALPAAKRGIEFDLQAPDTWDWPLHRESVSALLDNLLDNAIKYAPLGGAVKVALAQRGDAAELRIEDTGPGIAAELRAKVFERFFRIAGSEQEGSGLGLAIAARAATRNAATITLADAEHGAQGLLVVVTFTPAPGRPAPATRHR